MDKGKVERCRQSYDWKYVGISQGLRSKLKLTYKNR
jgi:hypothetical protein